MKYSTVLSEKKTAWAIVLLYITLIFITLGDVVPIVNFAEKKLGNNFDFIMKYSLYFFFSGFFVYITAIKKERRLTQYIYYILILIAFILVIKGFVLYPAEYIHLIEYSIFGALFFWTMSLYGLSLLASYGVTVFVALLVGSADEIAQSFIPMRFFDFKDILINFQSGILGAAVYAGFVQYPNGSEDEKAQELENR